MTPYKSIVTVFRRNPEDKFKTVIPGEYALPEFEYLKDNHWIFTEKIHGTNIRIQFDANTGTIWVKGRSEASEIPDFLYTMLQDKFQPQIDTFKEYFAPYLAPHNPYCCLYGEACGAKIQKGGGLYNPDGQSFVLLDCKLGERCWVPRHGLNEISDAFGLQITPIIGEGTLPEMVGKVTSLLKSTWGDFEAEGIVAYPAVALRSRASKIRGRIRTKIKGSDFHFFTC